MRCRLSAVSIRLGCIGCDSYAIVANEIWDAAKANEQQTKLQPMLREKQRRLLPEQPRHKEARGPSNGSGRIKGRRKRKSVACFWKRWIGRSEEHRWGNMRAQRR